MSHKCLEEQWQIPNCVSFIQKNKATRIGLQFPDHLLKQSVTIQGLLKAALTRTSKDGKHRLFIMADTTFAPCCVDGISAQHVHAEVIIHYGWTCCSPTKKIPVLHVLGKRTFNIPLLEQLLSSPIVLKETFSSFSKVLILYEPHYHHLRGALLEIADSHKEIEFIISEIHNESSLRCNKNNDQKIQNNQNHELNGNDDEKGISNQDVESPSSHHGMDHFCGFYHDALLDQNQWNEALSDDSFSIDSIKSKYAVLFIGNDSFDEYAESPSSENQLYLSLLTNFGSCYRFISYDPQRVESYLASNENEKENDNDNGNDSNDLTNGMNGIGINDAVNGILEHHEIEEIFSIQRNDRLLSKILMYRYSLMEMVKESDIIGIVCATLVVPRYLEMINMLKRNILNCGKKPYLFSIGKINQAKLGNFSEIDIFVVITCPLSFHYLLPVQQQSFFKKLVTPFDCMLALNAEDDAFKWTAMYSTDFNDVLDHSFKMGGIQRTEEDDMKRTEEDRTVSVFGKSGALIKRDAVDYMLEKRTWRGVEFVDDTLQPSKVEQGLQGIASQYQGPFK